MKQVLRWVVVLVGIVPGALSAPVKLTPWTTNALGGQQVTATGSLTNRHLDMTAATNVWEDINFSPSGMNPVGLAGAATLVIDAGPAANMLALDFDAAGTDVAAVNPQMSHIWTAGTTVYPHVHVLPKTAGDGGVVWKITAMSADIGGTMMTNAVVTQTNTLAGGTNQHRHLLWNLPAAGIALTNAVGPSTMQLLRIERLGDDDGDTYAGAMSVIGFDVHYRWGGSPVPYTP